MADRKISDLTALTTPATGDLIPIVDISEAAAADKNKSITIQELFKGVPDGTAAAPGLAFESDDGNGIYKPGTDQVAISTGGTGRLFVDASGRVLMGTTTEGEQTADDLTIATSGDTGMTIRSGDTNKGNIFFSDATVGVGEYRGYIEYNHNGDALSVGTANTERLRIDSSGRVGIGTSSPTSLLDVFDPAGTIKLRTNANTSTQLRFEQGTTFVGAVGFDNVAGCVYLNRYGAANQGIAVNSSGNVGVGTTSPDGNVHIADSTRANLILKKTGLNDVASGTLANEYDVIQLGAGGSFASYNVETATADTHIGHNFYRHSSGPQRYKYTDAAARIRFNSSQGEIIFDRAASGTANTNITFSESLRIDSSGRVGIGTSSPPCRLAVRTAGADGITLQQDTGTSTYSARLFFESSTNTSAIYNNNGNLFFNRGATAGSSSGTTSMTITSGGSVGIGTTSPAQLLQVGSTNGEVRIGGSNGLEITHNNASYTTAEIKQLYATTNANAQLKITSGFTTFHTGTSNTERARIAPGGQLLVGTSSAVGNYSLQIEQNPGTDPFTGSILLRRGLSNASIVGDGYYLGVISAGSQTNIGGSIRFESDATWGTDDYPTRLVFSTTADGASSPTERMRISQNGNVWIGQTSDVNTARLEVTSSGSSTAICTSVNSTSSRTHLAFFNPNGLVGTINSSGSSTSFNTSSDYRLKENVVPLTDAANRVSQLQVHRFNFIADPDRTVDGFIAHEVQTVVPEAISGEKDAVDDDGNPIYQGIDQSKLVPLLTAALQEAIGEIESLKARVAALESA